MSVLTRMIRLHLDTFGYTIGELAKLFDLYEGQLGQFYDLSAEAPVTGMRLRIVQ